MNDTIREFPTTGPITASVRVGGGTIVVTASDRSTVAVTVDPEDGSAGSRAAAAETTVEFADGRLTVESRGHHGGWLPWRSGQVRVQLHVPNGSTLLTETGSADVHTSGQLGDVTFHSGSGDAMLGHLTGDLTAESGSGDIRVITVGGVMRAHTSSGDIEATTVGGTFDVKTASGDIRLGSGDGPVRTTSASGDVKLGAVQSEEVRVVTASGDVSVGVPTGTSVWLDLDTTSGTTRSELTMTDQPADPSKVLKLHVRTASGDITVRRVLGARAA